MFHTIRTAGIRHVWLWPVLLSLACFVLLAGWLLWPVVCQPDQVVGNQIAHADAWQKVYFFWHTRYALEHFTNPLFNRLLFAPHGASLTLEPIMLPLALVTLPIQYLAGPVVAYNAATLLTLILNGVAVQLLAWHFVRRWIASLVAGIAMLASPIALSVIWHGQLEKAIWFPSILFLVALAEALGQPLVGRRWWLLPIAAFWLVIAALSGLYVFLFTAIFAGPFVLAQIHHERLGWFSALAKALTVALLSLIPCWLLFGQDLQSSAGSDNTIWIAISRTQGADLLDLLLPLVLHPARLNLWQYSTWPHTGNWQSAVSWIVLLLALVGMLRAWRRVRWLALLALVMLILGLGATLKVAGIVTGIPLPYRLLEGLPGVSVSRYPQMAFMFVHLILAIIAAYGFHSLTRNSSEWVRILGAGLVPCGLLLELGGWQVQPQPLPIAPAYTQLAALPTHGSLLAVPSNTDIANQMVYQMAHQKPIWGGYLARIPEYYEIEHVAILRQFWRGRIEPPDIVRYTEDDLRTILHFFGVEYISIDRTQLDQQSYAILAALRDSVVHTAPDIVDPDTEISIIPVPDQMRPQVLIRLGWWELENERRWMSRASTLQLLNPGTTTVPVELHLTLTDQRTDRLSLAWPNGSLPDLQLTGAPEQIVIPLQLPPGQHELRISAATQEETVLGVKRQVSVQVSEVSLVAR